MIRDHWLHIRVNSLELATVDLLTQHLNEPTRSDTIRRIAMDRLQAEARREYSKRAKDHDPYQLTFDQIA